MNKKTVTQHKVILKDVSIIVLFSLSKHRKLLNSKQKKAYEIESNKCFYTEKHSQITNSHFQSNT